MQYILTEEEFKNLVPKFRYEEKIKEIKELQQLIMKTAGHTCIYFNMTGGIAFTYCDNCPLAQFDCGYTKYFSK